MATSRAQLLELFDDDPEILEDVAEAFLSVKDAYLQAFVQACAQKDHASIEAAAHRMKGAVACFAATDLVAALQKVESEANQKSGFPDQGQLELIQEEVTKLVDCLEAEAKND